MKTGKEYIASGILEQYVLGCTSPATSAAIERRAAADPAIQQEIDAISAAMQTYAQQHAVAPNPVLKPFLMATIDYTERLKNGEPASFPPTLNEGALIADYAQWLNRNDMVTPGTADVYAKIIGHTATITSAIVWIKDYAPQEVHDNEYEKFLIVEGTCEIIVGDDVHVLKPGDYFQIPLHKTHLVKVTSAIPCKVILQRVAA
jgi:quercetin dioxygenase-like cupin family protein